MALFTATEYKTSRGISGTDYDTRIADGLGHVETFIRRYCGRNTTNGFESAERTETYDGNGLSVLYLNEWPITAVDSVSLRTSASAFGTTLESTEYYTGSQGRIYRYAAAVYGWTNGEQRSVWPEGDQNIQIVYTGGYATIPDDLKEACYLCMDSWFASAGRDSLNLASESMGVLNFNTLMNAERQSRLASLLRDFTRVGLA